MNNPSLLWKTLVMLLVIISPKHLLCQVVYSSKDYYFEVECPVFACEINGTEIDSSFLVAPSNSKFKLIEMHESYCIIRFYIFDKKLREKYNFVDAQFEHYKYFVITRAQFDFKAKPLVRKRIDFSFGNVVAPMKIRTNPSHFSKDFMLGPTFGVKYENAKQKELTINFLLGAGLSAVTIDSLTTDGRFPSSLESLAFTPSIGMVVQFGTAQVGLFAGLDIAGEQSITKNWIYDQKIWLALGFGYAIFSDKKLD